MVRSAFSPKRASTAETRGDSSSSAGLRTGSPAEADRVLPEVEAGGGQSALDAAASVVSQVPLAVVEARPVRSGIDRTLSLFDRT